MYTLNYCKQTSYNIYFVSRCNLYPSLIWRSWARAPSKTPVVSLSKKLYPCCLVLVGSRNGFERDFTIELNYIQGLMEDWLKCQTSPLVKYHQKKRKKFCSVLCKWHNYASGKCIFLKRLLFMSLYHVISTGDLCMYNLQKHLLYNSNTG